MYEKEAWIKKDKQKTPSKESHLTQMHLWHLSTIPSFWVEYFAERLLKGVS